MNASHLIACHDCGQLHRLASIPRKSTAKCRRCDAVLYRRPKNSLDRTLAMTWAAAILFILANAFPILELQLQGQWQAATLFTSIKAFYQQDLWALSLVILMTTIIMPFVEICGLLFVLMPLKYNRVLPGMAASFRWIRHLKPWGMVEVFMLAILVSVVKLADMATIIPEISLFCFGGMILTLTAASAALEPHDVWTRIALVPNAQSGISPRPCYWTSCHGCQLLLPRRDAPCSCPRCHAQLHHRKPKSISRTWALVIAAFIMYIPANMLPITTMTSMGKTQSDTIMSGVIYFVITGSWPLALIIFIASIVVPLAKLLILSFLLISVQKKSAWRPKDRTRLYRFTEAVGRWSMLDIYVVSLMVALINFGPMASASAGPGALAFASVVIITMFAAMSFDPRLIWDSMESPHVLTSK